MKFCIQITFNPSLTACLLPEEVNSLQWRSEKFVVGEGQSSGFQPEKGLGCYPRKRCRIFHIIWCISQVLACFFSKMGSRGVTLEIFLEHSMCFGVFYQLFFFKIGKGSEVPLPGKLFQNPPMCFVYLIGYLQSFASNTCPEM